MKRPFNNFLHIKSGYGAVYIYMNKGCLLLFLPAVTLIESTIIRSSALFLVLEHACTDQIRDRQDKTVKNRQDERLKLLVLQTEIL